eukprot:IDg17923t1
MNDMRALTGGTIPPQEPLASNGIRVDLRDCIDPASSVAVAGHSFGGGTALAFAFAAKRRDFDANVSHVICLDAWLTPLGIGQVESGDVGDARVLFVDQERTGVTMSTDGSHNNATDFATRLPAFVAVLGGLTARGSDPDLLMEAQNKAVVSFFSERWDAFWHDLMALKVNGLAPSFGPQL